MLCKWFNEQTGQIISSQKNSFCDTWIFLKDKALKEAVSSMDIITTSSTEEIISQSKCQMMFLDKFLLKQNVDKNDDKFNYLFNVGVSIHLW